MHIGQQKTNVAAIVGGVLGGVIALGIIIALSVTLGVSDHIRKSDTRLKVVTLHCACTISSYYRYQEKKVNSKIEEFLINFFHNVIYINHIFRVL